MKNWTFPLVLTCIGFAAGLILYASPYDVLWRDMWLPETLAAEAVWGYITHLGDGVVQVLGCMGMGVLTYLKGQYALSRAWFWAAPLSLAAGLVGQVAKWTLGRPRPKLYPELYDLQWLEAAARLHSFPSGHTLTSFAIAAMLAPFYLRARYVLLALALLAGVSRIFVGAHWPADVVCGAFFGYALGHVFVRLKKLSTYKDTTEA